MTAYEALTLIVALLSVIIAAVSLIRTRRLSDQQQRMQRKQEELADVQLQLLRREVAELARRDSPPADVRMTLESRGGSDHRFIITNWGTGAARNVNVSIPSHPENSPLVQGDYDEKLPILELLPGDRVSLIAALTMGMSLTFDTVLTWTDPDGSEQRRERQVSLA
jgi:hypothetical protein